eukprot:3761797-Pleurochrysis_carterae.AAC.1
MRGGDGDRAPCGFMRGGDVRGDGAGLPPFETRDRFLPAALGFPADAGLSAFAAVERKRVETGKWGDEAAAAAGATACSRARLAAAAGAADA